MQRYLEIRTITSTNLTVGADLARHLLARQHLGNVAIICDKPLIFMSVVRKYWFRLTRSLQKERSSTLNAERILQLTYDITHMQRLEFVARPFAEATEADVFFLAPDQLSLPSRCFSVYILADLSGAQLQAMLSQLPENALVIDYSHNQVVVSAALLPKRELEVRLDHEWQQVSAFLRHHDITVAAANQPRAISLNADDLLDKVLDVGNSFLRASNNFVELLRLSQPLNLTSTQQQRYELVATLNRRVYALTPGSFSQQFMQSLHDDDLAFHESWIEHMAMALSV